MRRLGNISTRRLLFRVMATGVAAVPFLAMGHKSADAFGDDHEWDDRGRHPGGNDDRGDHDRGDHGAGNRSGQGGVSCLLRGTNVLTPVGGCTVEDLQIGDQLLTLSGPMAIKWIGYNKFTKEKGRAWPDSVMPIRIARFAIDEHSPHSDLYLSPLHCIFFNEVLIPVKYLINGTSVAPGAHSEMPEIEYYHIDLGTHEVLDAEGALVESFFDRDSEREHFSNFVQYERLYGAERQPKMAPFAPILGYRNRRQKIEGVARSLISNIVDVRDPVQLAYEQIARRAEAMVL
jgi:hypothetical protein